MKTSRKYAVAVALLVVLAVAFGVIGTVAPPLAEEVSPQQESSSESVGHFQNPPTYDSGWVDIRAKAGQYVTLKHDLNTSEVVVDVAGKQSLDPNGGALAWSKTYGGGNADKAQQVIQTGDGGYAVIGSTYTDVYGYDFWLVKADSDGNHQWNQTYYKGGASTEFALSLVQTGDGGYALAGYTDYWAGAGGYDFWLVKTESSGHVLWSQTYGGANADVASSVVQTSDGGYAIAGSTQSFGAGLYDFWLVNTDSAGNALWNRTYGGASSDVASSVVQTGDGGYALVGYTTSYGAGQEDIWLVKTNSTGNMEWNRTYGGASRDYGYSVVQTSDGGYAVAGTTFTSGEPWYDFWLVKTDSAGNALWNRTYGGADSDYGYSVVQTSDGGYALAGSTNSYGAGGSDLWLVKTDSAGNHLWNETYGGPNTDTARSVVQTGDGGYALAGDTFSYGAGSVDMGLVKVMPEMNVEHRRNLGGTGIHTGWSRTYGGTHGDVASSVVQTSDGGYALAGYFNYWGSGRGEDFWLVKTDSAGNVLWNKTYDKTIYDYAYSLVQTNDGGYALAGEVDFGVWLVKTDAAGNALWNKTYGGAVEDRARQVIQTSDGGYALAGYTDNYGSGFWLVKTDSAGNALWNKTYAGDTAYSLVQTNDEGYALAGYTYTYEGGYDFWVVKTDSTGTLQWNKTYTRGGADYAYSLVQTSDGGYMVAGKGGWYDAWLVKIDSAGNEEWNRTYGGPSYIAWTSDTAYSVVQTGDGGYALAGYTDSYGAGGVDFWLVKLDSAGNVAWTQTYGGAGDDFALSLVRTSDGGYALAGYTDSYGAGQEDFWLVKSDVELGLTRTSLTSHSITLYRGKTDLDWNYVRVRIWLIKEPSWIYGDINMDGIVDAKDLYIIGRNYGKTFSLLSLTGIVAVAGIHTVKKRKQSKQPSYIS